MTVQMPVAVVTDGTDRLGRHLSVVLASRGYRVVILHRTSAGDAHSLVAAIQASGGSSRALHADIAVHTDVRQAFLDLGSREGRVDVLVNTGSDPQPQDVTQLEPATWDATLARNLSGVYYCCHHTLRLMPDGGQIISIGTAGLEGVRAKTRGTDYYVSATGLLVLTRALAAAYARRQIRVNMVSPARRDDVTGPPSSDEMGVETPPAMSDIGQAVTYLLDASYVSGVNIEIAGGHWHETRTPSSR